MNSINIEPLTGQFSTISDGIDQAIAWIDENRKHSPRLQMEADRLSLKLRRQRYKSRNLEISSSCNPGIGLYGQFQSGKSHLLNALVAGDNAGWRHCSVTRFWI